MKHFLMITILASFFIGTAFAEEVETECPMMRELTERTNPKANIGQDKTESKKPTSVTAQ